MSKGIVIIVDPFSTGSLIAPELKKCGFECYAVKSSVSLPGRFTDFYTGEGFSVKKLYTVEEIKVCLEIDSVVAILPGAETGVYCAEALSYFYKVKGNNYITTDWRRKKSSMQERLRDLNIRSISSKKIDKYNVNIDEINSENGYVIKPDNSCLTDGVLFIDNKRDLISFISNIDWEKKNIIGDINESYLIQEKLEGEEFVVDLVVDNEIKVCTLCKYKKGLHNGSYFVYESLEVFDVGDNDYKQLIQYAKFAAKALGVDFGLAHLEIMNTKQGPILIELGARLHGGIAPMVFEKCYSPGLLNSAIELINNRFDASPSVLIKKARIVFLINNNENLCFKNISDLETKIKKLLYVEHVKFFIKDNEKIPLTTDLSNCPGIVSLIAESDEELNNAEIKVRNLFK